MELLKLGSYFFLKIKPAQSIRGAHRDRVCMCIFIGVSAHMCMSIYVCTVFQKKRWLLFFPTYIFYPTTVAAAKSELSYFLVQENEGNMVKNAQAEDDLRLDSSAYSHHLF
jgi:hypothetical protein